MKDAPPPLLNRPPCASRRQARCIAAHGARGFTIIELMIVMVVLARVDPSRNNAAQISPVGRTARKLGGLLLTLLTAVAVDTLLSAVGLVGPVLAPAGVTKVITSFPATVVLYLIATWSVTRWVHLLGLHIPSLAGIRRAPMQLPKQLKMQKVLIAKCKVKEHLQQPLLQPTQTRQHQPQFHQANNLIHNKYNTLLV